MAFEDKPLADVIQDDIKNLIESGRTEGPTLEYKSDLYDNTERSNREFLLDMCMFANARGGTILIGVQEVRDEAGQPTGTPDATAELGIVHPNPEQQLLTYESRILEAIDERLAVESRAVPCANGRHVIVFRIPNSLGKPHRVRYQGRTYFPCRRERHRYELDAREIKDLAMRTASQSERSQTSVELAITKTDIIESDGPMLVVALLPVFSSNFVVDLKRQEVFSNLMTFPLPSGGSAIPSHSVDGLRRVTPHNGSLSFAHNGLLKLRQLIPTASPRRGDLERFYPTAIDLFLRSMVVGAASLFEAAGLSAPALLGVSLWTIRRYIAAYSDESVGAEFPSKAPHCFPILPLTTLGPSADTQLRQLCDLIHQTFGISGTPCFTADGRWQGVLPRV